MDGERPKMEPKLDLSEPGMLASGCREELVDE